MNYPKQKEDIQKIEHFVDRYENLQANKVIDYMNNFVLPSENIENRTMQKAPLGVQMKWLFWRNKIFAKREKLVVAAKFGMTIFLSFLIMFTFWRSSDPNGISFPPDHSVVQNTAGAMFMILSSQFMGNTFPNILVFQIERPIFLRE